MRLLCSLLAVALAVVMLAACNSSEMNGNRAGSSAGSSSNSVATTSPASPSAHIAPSDGVKRVTTVEVRDALDKGTAIVVDVRAASAYQQSHIKGSINIPVEQTEARLNELPRDKMIVTYCSWPAEHTSARAVQIMQGKGIQNAAALLGGTNAWQSAGLPMASGQSSMQ